MKLRNIQELDLPELVKRESELRETIFSLRTRIVNGQVDNVKEIRAIRKELARVKTVHREKQLSAAKAPSER
ncbi:MAG: 50S ribosomal protein L29 [Deltaproteobacteria bacterium]|nr:50S ribosomal protein L29 [Deltaproteobacteria bacterium]